MFVPSGIGNSLRLEEIYTLSDSDYMKMLYYTGDEIHLSLVTSFRTERFGSQHSNPQPLLIHGQLLCPTPFFFFFFCQVLIYIPFLYEIALIYIIILVNLLGSSDFPVTLIKALCWRKIRLLIRISVLCYNFATYSMLELGQIIYSFCHQG